LNQRDLPSDFPTSPRIATLLRFCHGIEGGVLVIPPDFMSRR
jgi:hypothetical protein